MNKIIMTQVFASDNGALMLDVIATSRKHYNARIRDSEDNTFALTPFRDAVDEALADGRTEINKILSAN